MKTIYLSVILLLATAVTKAQLRDTQWRGKLNVPDETDVILDFKKDSVDIIIADQGVVGEAMAYSVTDSIITMKKTNGSSPCNIGDLFKIKYLIKGDKLFISNLSDPCDARTLAWTKEPLFRIKQ